MILCFGSRDTISADTANGSGGVAAGEAATRQP